MTEVDSGKLAFLKRSLRSRFVLFGVATIFLCALITVMFFPIINLTLESLLDRSLQSMQEVLERQATTIARLLVLEFAQDNRLLRVDPEKDQPADLYIKGLIWTKVTFNEGIQGIELIRTPPDNLGQYLTYLFYRREAPELEPMPGPQKLLKKFSGLEKDLLDSINATQAVDKQLLDSVNRGPKQEGEMLLRYLPVYVLLAEEGARYWGVAKIGVDTSGMRQILAIQSQETDRVRRAVWFEITLCLVVCALVALILITLWTGRATLPLKNLTTAASSLKDLKPQDLTIWLDNVRRVETRGQAEAAALQDSLLRLGAALPRLGEELILQEQQACMARLTARILRLWLREGPVSSDSEVSRLEEQLRARLTALLQLYQPGPEEWQRFDLAGVLDRLWPVATLGLPAGVQPQLEIKGALQLWGSPAGLSQAILYLLDFAAGQLQAGGTLHLKAGSNHKGEVDVVLKLAGHSLSPQEGQQLLQPFQTPGGLRPGLGPALAAAVARQHGGSLTIQLSEEPGGDLVLWLKLPAAPQPAAAAFQRL